MAYSFIEIEKRKNRVIFPLFCFVVAFYFITSYILLILSKNVMLLFSVTKLHGKIFFWPSIEQTLLVLAIAFLIAVVHWGFSVYNIIEKITTAIGAKPIDTNDVYHKNFKNLVDEVRTAIGGRHITPMVIQSAALNAFALEDFKGRAVIGVTEGLLSRLNRYHIESVVAHEAGHIISGDCLSTTITCSLAAIYEEALERVKLGLRHAGGSAMFLLLIIYAVIGLTSVLNGLLNCFISRQREYRADAIAVRLTRDPLGLAEALRLISKNWRGSGAQGEKIESIFILNPVYKDLDEEKGVISDLFSTHPPVFDRVNVLLNMAHTDIEIMENKLSDFQRISPVVSGELENNETDKRWMVFVDTSWLGPFSLDDLKGLDNFNPNQWIRQEGSEKVQLVSDYPELLKIFSDKKGGNVKDCCPYCKTGLREVIYEGTSILKCRQCEGIFVEQNKINRILVRTDKKFSEETIRMAKAILNDNSHSLLTPRDSRSVWKIKCPKCDLAMGRQFFQYSYPIEVDRCVRCYGIWFDKNELELLQYFYENNILGST